MPSSPPSSAFIALTWLSVFACQSEPRVGGATPESPRACEERQARFVAFLTSLPERSVAAVSDASLPVTTLGRGPGPGPVLRLGPDHVVLDGETLAETTLDARVERVSRWLSALERSSTPGKNVLYVAASAELEVRTLRAYLAAVPEAFEPKLLVRTQTPSTAGGGKARPEALELARELLSEQDPARRAARAVPAYQAFSTCAALDEAVRASAEAPLESRWPARRRALLEASSRCSCRELDTESLQQLASAEQRAGAAGLGALPAAFLRDHRCEASMGRRSIGKLVQQLEAFDAEFSGDWQQDALKFEEVLANPRLLNYFCNALPGEALAALERAKRSLYFRPRGAATCQAWRFEPLSPGAPMGTVRRVEAANQPPLAFHYRQAAEEIRFFGPAPLDSTTRATDERDWPCEQKYRLVSVDARSIETETTRWYLDEAACAAGSAPNEPSGCFDAALAGP